MINVIHAYCTYIIQYLDMHCLLLCAEPRREGPSSPVSNQKITLLLQCPAVKFITHPEFFTVLHANYVSAVQIGIVLWWFRSLDVMFDCQLNFYLPSVLTLITYQWFISFLNKSNFATVCKHLALDSYSMLVSVEIHSSPLSHLWSYHCTWWHSTC